MPDPDTRERDRTLLRYACVFLLAYLVYVLFQPFLKPLAWAAIFAAFFYQSYKRLEQRFGRTWAASIGTAAVTIMIIVPLVLLVFVFVQEATQAINSIDLSKESSKGFERLQRGWAWLQRQRFGRNLGPLDLYIRQAAERASGVVANGAGAIFRNIAVMVANIVIVLFALFFFFRDGEAIMERLRQVLPFEPSFREQRFTETGLLIRATITSGLTVAMVQGAIGGITFALLGIDAPIFWGVMMAFFALLPLGAGVIWAPVALWLLLTGETGRGIALMVVGAGGISLIDNLLRPILLAGRTEMNGLLVFISLLGGLAAFGLLGLVLGPVIMATTISFVDAYVAERRGGKRAAS
ncbi:MAG: AI-2E family transporter [Vicinamibacterales bacterium]|nr:AI-2E family transporter [Vicinamibacterales bacterium]